MRILLIVLFALTIQFGFSQEREREEKMQAMKIAYITKALDLSPQESTVFWPVYNQYESELKTLRKSAKRPNADIESLTDQEVDGLIEQRFDVAEKKIALERKLVSDLSGKLPKYKMVQLIHAEEKFKKEILSRVKQRMKDGELKNKEKYKRR